MFYLTTHSTHFIYGYMVKDHSESEKGNPLLPHRLLFSINSKGYFICTIPRPLLTSRGALVGTRNNTTVKCNESSLHIPQAICYL